MGRWIDKLRDLRDWLTLRDYEAAKGKAEQQIIARFSRGNVSIQNGWFIDKDRLAQLSCDAEKAVVSLRKLVARSA